MKLTGGDHHEVPTIDVASHRFDEQIGQAVARPFEQGRSRFETGPRATAER
jgi:hypothetical protein